MDNSSNSKDYPSFFEASGELPPVEDHIGTGFPSLSKDAQIAPRKRTSLDTGSIPSFSSAFDMED